MSALKNVLPVGVKICEPSVTHEIPKVDCAEPERVIVLHLRRIRVRDIVAGKHVASTRCIAACIHLVQWDIYLIALFALLRCCSRKTSIGQGDISSMLMVGWSEVGRRRQFEPRMLTTQSLGWKWLAAVACCIVSVVIYGHVIIKT